MKLGFICLNLPGHRNPMTALARRLQDRGHQVVFLYSSGAAGLPFVPGLEEDHINQNRPAVSKMQGEDALQFPSECCWLGRRVPGSASLGLLNECLGTTST